MERFGPYRLEQTINVGSIGEVFLAHGPVPEGGSGAGEGQGPLVVKRLHRELARRPAHVELFIEEGRTARRFAHPHLVHAFDAGSVERPAEDGEGAAADHYIAMELVRGPNLAQRTQAPPARAVLKVGVELCAGLEHMHQAGVVHCDVAPSNILLGPRRVQLTDFGVASPAGQAQPRVRGTIPYMSPEQAQGQPVDGRSDLFSLAVVLWELLAGRPLFLRSAPYLTLAAVVEDEVPALAGAGGAPPAVEEILRRALSKDPAGRFAGAADMGAALDRVLRTLDR